MNHYLHCLCRILMKKFLENMALGILLLFLGVFLWISQPLMFIYDANVKNCLKSITYRQPWLHWAWNDSSRSLGQQGEDTARLLSWVSGEQSLASTGICWIECYRTALEGRGAQETGWYSKIASSALWSDASQQRGS